MSAVVSNHPQTTIRKLRHESEGNPRFVKGLGTCRCVGSTELKFIRRVSTKGGYSNNGMGQVLCVAVLQCLDYYGMKIHAIVQLAIARQG